MADTIAVMHDGELQQLGTPREVYNKPVNAWVAGFVGEPAMNFVDATVQDRGGRTYFVHPNFAIGVTDEQQRIVASNGNRQKPPGLGRFSRMPGREAAGLSIKIRTKWQGGHGMAPCFPP